jgi:hypothetical protein
MTEEKQPTETLDDETTAKHCINDSSTETEKKAETIFELQKLIEKKTRTIKKAINAKKRHVTLNGEKKPLDEYWLELKTLRLERDRLLLEIKEAVKKGERYNLHSNTDRIEKKREAEAREQCQIHKITTAEAVKKHAKQTGCEISPSMKEMQERILEKYKQACEK